MPKRSLKPPDKAEAVSAPLVGPPHASLRTISEVVVLFTSVLLLAALGLGVQSVLSPFVAIAALVYLLYPLRKQELPRRLMVLGVIVFVLWFLYTILGILTPFLLSFLLAYILNPLVSRLERHHVPRWLSSLIIVIVMLGIVVLVALFGMPVVIQQFQGILNGLALIANDFAEMLRSGAIFGFLARYGIPVEKAQEVISQQLSPRLESILKTLFEAIFGFLTSLSSVALHIVNIIIVPFLVFYLLKDFPLVTHRFSMLVPRTRRGRFLQLWETVDHLMGKYFRGAVTVAIIQGAIATVGLWIIGVDYALILGIMTGLLDFIPYVGLLTSLVVASIVAIFSGGAVAAKIVAVVVLFLSQKVLEASVLGPRIIGHQVGLHPVLLILSLLVFGFFLGFVGLLIAVPATALVIALVKEWEQSSRIRRQAEGA